MEFRLVLILQKQMFPSVFEGSYFFFFFLVLHLYSFNYHYTYAIFTCDLIFHGFELQDFGLEQNLRSSSPLNLYSNEMEI